MSHKHYTKDEVYIMCLYEEAEKGGELEAVFDRFIIGTCAHMHPKGVNATCKLLIQANFIKKSGEEGIYLTPNGIRLVESLRFE